MTDTNPSWLQPWRMHPPLRNASSESTLSQEDRGLEEGGEDTRLIGGTRLQVFSEKERSARPYFHFRSVFWPWLIIILLVLVVLTLSGLVATQSRSIWTDCGKSPAEARSRGCSFDMLSHAWQTKECYDHETAEAYRKAGEWEYYLDRYAKYPVTEELVRQGETDVWLREFQHYTHCTYMWRQMHRAFTVLNHIDTHLNNFNHTLHCQKMFLESRDGDLLEVLAKVIYPSCHPV